MLTLSRYPFFRILPAFIAGIVIYDCNNRFVEPVWLSLLFILVLFAFLYQWPGKKPFTRFREVRGIYIFIVFMISGYISPSIRHPSLTTSCTSDSVDHYFARVVHYQGNKNMYGQYVFNIKKIRRNGKWIPANENVWVYLNLNDTSMPLSVNTEVLVKGHPFQVRPPVYKGLFDFGKYLQRNDISCIHYLNTNDLFIMGSHRNHSLSSKIGALREHLTDELQTMIPDQNESGLAKAMLLGDRSGINTGLRQAYNAAGVAHILAVSGLHTGIIFLIFSTLLMPLKLNRKFKWLYYVTVMAGIWFYALLTGLSPSVIRASLMFSIVLLGLLTGGRHQVYNSIAAAAFFMLLFDPWLIYSVSFQMSFLAVFGIVVLYPKLNALFKPEKRLWKYIWGITCVSTAAQIALFPLLIHYFHQFSPFFIISNLLIIPAATLILTFGMSLLAMESLDFSIPFLNHFFQVVLKSVNALVFKIESLPGSLIDDLYLNTFEVWLVYLLFTFLVAFIYFKSKKLLFAALMISLLSGFVFTRHTISNSRQKAVFIYRQPQSIHADFIRKNALLSYRYRNKLLGKSGALSITKIPGEYEVYSQENIFDTKRIHTATNYDLVVFENKSFLFLKQPIRNFYRDLSVDYLVICTPQLHVSDIPESFHFYYLITPCDTENGTNAIFSRKGQKLHEICLEEGKVLHIKL